MTRDGTWRCRLRRARARWALPMVAAAVTACAAPAPEPAPAGATVVEPPSGRGLAPVALPDFASMHEAVRAQMSAAATSLVTQIEDSAPPATLGAAYGSMGRLLMAATFLDAAAVCFENAEGLAPDDYRWPYYLGQIHRVTGPLAAAVEAFGRALADAPDDLATLHWLGEVHLAQGDPDAAATRFSHVLRQAPRSAAARFGAGRAALARRDYATAVQELEEALEREPTADRIHYSLGLAYRGLGDLERAETHLARQGEREPLPADPLMRELDVLLESPEAYDVRGGQALAEGDWSSAADQFRRGLALDPDNTSLRHRLGTVLAQLGEVEEAEAQFAEVVRRQPTHARAHFSLGVLMAASGRHRGATERFVSAVEHEPGYLPARLQLAAVLARTGRAAEAVEHYDRALALDPTLAEATYERAMALVRLERYREARDGLAAGMERFPEARVFAHALARLLAAAPDPEVRNGRRAREIAETLLAAEQSLDLGETIAMTLAELGQFDEAVAVQRDLVAAARQAGLDAVVARLRGNLRRYERGEPSRTPWADGELQ